MRHNILPLCEGEDFQRKSSLDAQNLNLALHCHGSTKSPLLQNGCWVLAFCLYRFFFSHLVLVFVVHWLGGSFAKLRF